MKQKVIPIVPAPAEQRVYARSVKGFFNNWRWAMVWLTQLLFYGLPWVTWNGKQAMLIDLEGRRFHFFMLSFTPQDLILLTLLLAISAFGLFLFTAVAGRVWCGYSCPQTVYTFIFQWIETRIEGDRGRRMRRDAGPRNVDWLWRKSAKHGVWLLLSLWTGFTFVGFFTPIRTLGHEVLTSNLGPWQVFWILFYGFATYGNAGWLREKVCKFMCPYARFQGVMFDDDTLTVTYDAARGEPRGSRSRQATRAEHNLGDCINCTLCVQVCPTGIDIRNGLQYECINCGACVDACDDVMDRMGYERGLIRYGTGTGLSLSKTPRAFLARLKRPRVLVYTALLAVLSGAMLIGVVTHSPLRADVLRDRTVMTRILDDGSVENLYRAHVTNASSEPVTVTVAVAGLAGIHLPEREQRATLLPGSNSLILHALLPPDHNVAKGTHSINFIISEDKPGGITLTPEASFLIN